MIKAQDDVDILAFDKTGKKVLLCECKFRNKPMPMEEYDDLVMAAEMFKNAEVQSVTDVQSLQKQTWKRALKW